MDMNYFFSSNANSKRLYSFYYLFIFICVNAGTFMVYYAHGGHMTTLEWVVSCYFMRSTFGTICCKNPKLQEASKWPEAAGDAKQPPIPVHVYRNTLRFSRTKLEFSCYHVSKHQASKHTHIIESIFLPLYELLRSKTAGGGVSRARGIFPQAHALEDLDVGKLASSIMSSPLVVHQGLQTSTSPCLALSSLFLKWWNLSKNTIFWKGSHWFPLWNPQILPAMLDNYVEILQTSCSDQEAINNISREK